MLRNEGGVRCSCRMMRYISSCSFHQVLEKQNMVEQKASSTNILFIEYSLFHTVLPWITPVSAEEAFILNEWEKSLWSSITCLFLPMLGNVSLSGGLPAWKNMSGDTVQHFSVVPFDRSCSIFWQRTVSGHWRIPAFGSSFPSLKPDSSDKCLKTVSP